MKFSRNFLMGTAVAAVVATMAVGSNFMPTNSPVMHQQISHAQFKFPWSLNPTPVNVHDVDSYPTSDCRSTPKQFDGKLLYKCAFQGIMRLSLKLEKEDVREKFATEWEHKHDNDKSLDTSEGADKAVLEMLNGLGERFNYYQNEAAVKQNKQTFNASFVGIGAELTLVVKPGEKLKKGDEILLSPDHRLTVIRPMPDSPASKVDLKKGDIITHVDGVSIDGMTMEKAIEEKIKGPKNTKVTLTLLRDGVSHDVTIGRDEVVQKVVTEKKFVADDIFYFRLEKFDSRFFGKEITDALNTGKGAKAVIVDMRSNPGGLLPYADFLTESLLSQGRYLETRARDGSEITTEEKLLEKDIVLKRSGNDISGEKRAPLLVPEETVIIVLIDQGSASASEIVAGALKANHRATIVGMPSHGKGVGQTENPLPFGRAERVISFEFKPGGQSIDWTGVQVDYEVKSTIKEMEDVGVPAKDAQLQAAIEQAQKEIKANEAAKQKSDATRKEHEEEFKAQQEQMKKFLEHQNDPNAPDAP